MPKSAARFSIFIVYILTSQMCTTKEHRHGIRFGGFCVNCVLRGIATSKNVRAKLAFAFGEESGPQPYQLCHMQIRDLNQAESYVWLRDSTGEHIVGWTPYGDKTAGCLKEWLEMRPSHRHHDNLL